MSELSDLEIHRLEAINKILLDALTCMNEELQYPAKNIDLVYLRDTAQVALDEVDNVKHSIHEDFPW